MTNYTYNGKLLTHLEKNGDNIHFSYDAQGQPAMVDYKEIPHRKVVA